MLLYFLSLGAGALVLLIAQKLDFEGVNPPRAPKRRKAVRQAAGALSGSARAVAR